MIFPARAPLRLIVLLAITLNACAPDSTPSTLAFDSYSMIALTAESDAGVLVTHSTTPDAFLAEIKQQLLYATGHLGHALEAVPALARGPSITIRDVRPGIDGTNIVRYSLRLDIAWKRPPSLADLPESYTLILPVSTDTQGLKAFATNYGVKCGGDTNPGSLFYYYDPLKPGCPLSADPAPLDILRLPLQLRISEKNTEGKFPEYGKVWEDGQLDVAFISGNMSSPSSPKGGIGLINRLKVTFGEPTAYTIESTEFYDWITASYATVSGPLNVTVIDILKDTIQRHDSIFAERFAAASAAADLVAYNGHAGLGANIRAFSQLGRFASGRYYIYWLNACRPFAYLEETLDGKVVAANPGSAPARYLDIATVTDLGRFSLGGDVKKLIDALVGQRLTYREITASISLGGPAVLGEEDNRWPLPFED